MNRHRRQEAKRARRRARVGRSNPVKRAEQQAAAMLAGQENWQRFTGLRFPVHLGMPGSPKR